MAGFVKSFSSWPSGAYMPKLVMTQASCRVTVHFIAAAQRLGQATVIIDEHAGQRIEQIRGEFRPLGLGKIEGERLNFGERGQERDHTRISPPIKNAVPQLIGSGCCAGTVQPRSLRRGTRRRRAAVHRTGHSQRSARSLRRKTQSMDVHRHAANDDVVCLPAHCQAGGCTNPLPRGLER